MKTPRLFISPWLGPALLSLAYIIAILINTFTAMSWDDSSRMTMGIVAASGLVTAYIQHRHGYPGHRKDPS